MDINRFNTLASHLRKPLHQAAERWLSNAPRGCDTPDDVVQDTLLRLWAIRDRLEGYESVEALAMVAAHRLAIDAMRRSASLRADSLDEAICGELSDLSPEDSADNALSEQLASQLLASLPDRQALIVRMRHSDGLELSEIAALTGISEGNVRVLLSRGRARLRQLYLSQVS